MRCCCASSLSRRPRTSSIRHGQGQVFTTGSWYFRLAKAVAQPRVAGALSSAMTALPSDAEERARNGLRSLPPIIGMLDLRALVPTMVALDVVRPLNFLAAEAIAAAVLLDGGLVVSTTSPLIEHAAAHLGLTCQLLQSAAPAIAPTCPLEDRHPR